MAELDNSIMRFYAGDSPEMFEIERRCMDKEGAVIQYLDNNLSNGNILDIGAGNGFTAEKLNNVNRKVIALEPDEKIATPNTNLVWVKGVGQDLPFHNQSMDGAYSTWAFYFPSFDKEMVNRGLMELNRVVKKGSKIIIVDNAGDDEFSSFTDREIGNFDKDKVFWNMHGFTSSILNSHFIFDSVEEARKLLGFYFGKKGYEVNDSKIDYRIAIYQGESGKINMQ